MSTLYGREGGGGLADPAAGAEGVGPGGRAGERGTGKKAPARPEGARAASGRAVGQGRVSLGYQEGTLMRGGPTWQR